MGKRELLLIVCFLIVGAVVYQATAPPAGPNEQGFSFSRIVDHIRREVRGNRATAEKTTKSVLPIDDAITELRIVERFHEVHITGEDRDDVEASLHVNSNAYTEEEARQFAEQTVLQTDKAASSLVLRVQFLTGRQTGRQRATLTVKVPSRLRIRLESRPGELTIDNVAEVEATNAGGEAKIRRIAGRAVITHRGGSLLVEQAAALKLVGRGAEITVADIAGDASVNAEGGFVKGKHLAGSIEIESRHSEILLEGLEKTRGPIRVNADEGAVTLKGLAADTRVDSRSTELDISMSAAAPVALYTEGEDIVLTPPPGGYELDAVVIDGRMLPEPMLDDLGLERAGGEGDNTELRVSGSVDGGGPAITIRSRHGDVTLRSREAPPEDK